MSSAAIAAPCLVVTLTGTAGGPQQPFNGLASAGTLVRYGEDRNNCDALKLQFDVGRGTTMRLSQLGVGTEQLNAVFFTHMHNDHTEGFADLIQSRWAFHGTGPKIDAICSADVVSPQGFTVSCRSFVTHIADAFIKSGEIAQRHSEVKERTAGGPADLVNTITFDPKDEPQVLAPPRKWSTSDQVETLAKGADLIVHSAIHPVMAPGLGSGLFPYAYYRQTTVPDLGAMAQRAGAKYLMLTHLIPSIGAPQQYPFKVPGNPLTEADYKKAAQDGGFTGQIIVGTDLASLRLPGQ